MENKGILKKKSKIIMLKNTFIRILQIQTINILLIVFLFVFTSSCYPSIKGTVVDSETGNPIEGAVVLVQWTKTKGLPGMPYHEVYKIIEAETDKAGKFNISSTLNPFVDAPEIVIYKEGYVAWRNDYIFPDYRKRENFKWQNNYVYKMERFKENYSKEEHHSFMSHGIIGDSLEKTPKYFGSESKELEEALREKRKSY